MRLKELDSADIDKFTAVVSLNGLNRVVELCSHIGKEVMYGVKNVIFATYWEGP